MVTIANPAGRTYLPDISRWWVRYIVQRSERYGRRDPLLRAFWLGRRESTARVGAGLRLAACRSPRYLCRQSGCLEEAVDVLEAVVDKGGGITRDRTPRGGGGPEL